MQLKPTNTCMSIIGKILPLEGIFVRLLLPYYRLNIKVAIKLMPNLESTQKLLPFTKMSSILTILTLSNSGLKFFL